VESDYGVFSQFFKYDGNTGEIFYKDNIELNGSKAGKRAGHVKYKPNNRGGYRIIHLHRKNYAEHRVAWLLHYGVWPTMEIDHINGVRDDNRIVNLRDVSRRINAQNKICHRQNRILGGTSNRKGKFTATIHINSKMYYLGTYSTIEEASKVYIQAAENAEKGILPDNVSAVRGTFYKKSRGVWGAAIFVKGQRIPLEGEFLTEEEAHIAFLDAKDQMKRGVVFVKKEKKGCYYNKINKKWNPRINIKGRTLSLGYYNTYEEAREKRLEAERLKEQGLL